MHTTKLLKVCSTKNADLIGEKSINSHRVGGGGGGDPLVKMICYKIIILYHKHTSNHIPQTDNTLTHIYKETRNI